MRKLLVAVAVLAVLVAAGLTTWIASLNRSLARNHDRILGRVAAALGRGVTAGAIHVYWLGGIGVSVDEIHIAEDPRFGTGAFVDATTLTAHPKLWPLLRRQFQVGRVDITQAQIRLVRDAAGSWNYASLGRSPGADASNDNRQSLRATFPLGASAGDGADVGAAPAIEYATISDSTLIVVDQTEQPPRSWNVAAFNAAVHYSGPQYPIGLRVAAAVESAARNLDLHGTVAPANEQGDRPVELEGTLGPLGTAKLRLEALRVVATVGMERVEVSQLSARVFRGGLLASGRYLRGSGEVTFQGHIKDVRVGEAVHMVTGDVRRRVGGTARIAFDMRSKGTIPETIESELTGTCGVDVKDGVIKDFNIANEVLARANGLPVIGTLVSDHVRHRYAWLLTEPDTRFETLHATFAVAGKQFSTNDLTLAAPDFALLGRGSVGFDRQAHLAAVLRMSKPFSDDIAADVKAAKHLFDDHGQLVLPFHLQGKLGEAKPSLDSDDIATIVQRALNRRGGKRLLDGLLSGKAPPPSGQPREPLNQDLRDLLGR